MDAYNRLDHPRNLHYENRQEVQNDCYGATLDPVESMVTSSPVIDCCSKAALEQGSKGVSTKALGKV